MQFCTAEEIAAADDHSDLSAGLSHLSDLRRDAFDHIRIDTDLAAAEHFTTKLEHDAFEAVAVGGEISHSVTLLFHESVDVRRRSKLHSNAVNGNLASSATDSSQIL